MTGNKKDNIYLKRVVNKMKTKNVYIVMCKDMDEVGTCLLYTSRILA